jgi:hypothetical protein
VFLHSLERWSNLILIIDEVKIGPTEVERMGLLAARKSCIIEFASSGLPASKRAQEDAGMHAGTLQLAALRPQRENLLVRK